MIEGVLWTLILSVPIGYGLWRWLGVRAFERRGVRSRIRDTPALTATSREGDRVRVTGVVRASDSLATATLTRKSGVLARTRCWASRGRQDHSTAPWETFQMVPLVVETRDHGPVQVDSRYALLSIAPLSLRGVPYERNDAFLREHSLHSRGIGGWEEVVLTEGATVTCVGSLERVLPTAPTNKERGFRDAEPALLRLRGTLNAPILIAEAS